MRIFQDNEMIGSYTIDAFLGAGGMGEVYRGVQTNINRTAAIKVLKNFRNNESLTKRFYNEARVQSNLQHPNIAALYDFQEIDGRLCIFMEYVDGESLEDLIERRFFAIEDALFTFHAICEAVAFIHRHGIVHRDLKTQNIKLDSNGTVKLLDFGIAKDDESAKLTKTGGVIGTPNYIAPEQLAGKAADVQTDVWSLGIIFYEMLTGEHPFRSPTMIELYRKIEKAEFIPVEKLNPAIPHEVTAIVGNCLKKEKSARYANAGELAADVQRVLQNRYGVASGANSIKSSEPYSQTENYSESGVYSHPKKKSFLLPVLVGTVTAVFAVFALAGVAFWAMSGGEKNDVLKNSNAKNKDIPVVKQKDLKTADTKKPVIQTSGASDKTVEIKIDVIEGTAEFIRDEAVVGKTPYTIIGKVGEKIDIKLRREGFRDFETQIEISNGKKYYTFAMQKN